MDGRKPCGLQVKGPRREQAPARVPHGGVQGPGKGSYRLREGERALGSGLLRLLSHRERMKARGSEQQAQIGKRDLGRMRTSTEMGEAQVQVPRMGETLL